MIKEFKDDYVWLSNFYPCKIILKGKEYRSVEHAYQSAKSDDLDWVNFCLNTRKPGMVKTESQKIKIDRNIWDNKKRITIMKICLEQKYDQEPFKTKLLNTGDEILQEGNNWNDTFWELV